MEGTTQAGRGGLGRTVRSAWTLAATWPGRYGRFRREANAKKTKTSRAGVGCLGVMMFGWLFLLIPWLFVLAVEAVIVAWAALVTVIWLVAAPISAITHRRRQ